MRKKVEDAGRAIFTLRLQIRRFSERIRCEHENANINKPRLVLFSSFFMTSLRTGEYRVGKEAAAVLGRAASSALALSRLADPKSSGRPGPFFNLNVRLRYLLYLNVY